MMTQVQYLIIPLVSHFPKTIHQTADSNFQTVALCSMPVSTVVFIAAGCDLSCTLCYFMNLRTPFRISSVARGEHFRPGVYSLIEDVIAVEGSGGRAFREALDKRYQASPEFRNMLAKISLFWSLPALAVAGGVTAVIWTVPKSVAFGVGESALSRWKVPCRLTFA